MKLSKEEKEFYDAVMEDFTPLSIEEQKIFLQAEILSVIEMNQKLKSKKYTNRDVVLVCRELASQNIHLLTFNQDLIEQGINPKQQLLRLFKNEIMNLDYEDKKDGDA